MQLILRTGHEQLEIWNQHPCIAGKQLVPDLLLSVLHVSNTPRLYITFCVKQLISRALQFREYINCPSILEFFLGAGELLVGAPARRAAPCGAAAVSCHLGPVHAQRVKVTSASTYLR